MCAVISPRKILCAIKKLRNNGQNDEVSISTAPIRILYQSLSITIMFSLEYLSLYNAYNNSKIKDRYEAREILHSAILFTFYIINAGRVSIEIMIHHIYDI